MSRLIRLLKSTTGKGSLKTNELTMKCSKCHKRKATDPADGLCNSCRYDELLTEMTEKK